MKPKTTVIHHSADFDGLFCREIARKFLPDAELIGWDFSDAPLDPGLMTLSKGNQVYILDLPCDAPFGLKFPAKGPESAPGFDPIVWIDHHKSSIESHPKNIPGYRIDGVAACRLAWQFFSTEERVRKSTGDFVIGMLAGKSDFIDRKVEEPLAVRLAGEYDIWDKRDPRAELFQHGLRSRELGENMWELLLSEQTGEGVGGDGKQSIGDITVQALLDGGEVLQYARAQEYAEVIKSQGFDIEFEGLKFLACCSHECDIRSHLFVEGIKPHHDALFGFTYTGKAWRVSMYHAPGKEQHDLSIIANKYGGGGHRGACGFVADKLPFLK